MPLYTQLGGSWLNMTESVQRILVRRALAGTHFETVNAIIIALEAMAVLNACNTAEGSSNVAVRPRTRVVRDLLGEPRPSTKVPGDNPPLLSPAPRHLS